MVYQVFSIKKMQILLSPSVPSSNANSFLKEILCTSTDAITTPKGREETQQDLK